MLNARIAIIMSIYTQKHSKNQKSIAYNQECLDASIIRIQRIEVYRLIDNLSGKMKCM